MFTVNNSCRLLRDPRADK